MIKMITTDEVESIFERLQNLFMNYTIQMEEVNKKQKRIVNILREVYQQYNQEKLLIHQKQEIVCEDMKDLQTDEINKINIAI
jgi:hypothetical protein